MPSSAVWRRGGPNRYRRDNLNDARLSAAIRGYHGYQERFGNVGRMDASLKQYIRTVVDFPVKGVHFRDITTLLLEPRAFKQAIDDMADYAQAIAFDSIVAIDSRGFLFASALAYQLEKPLALVRKPNKLPGDKITEAYRYEYSEGALEVHTDAMAKSSKALVVDDLLATGGTALATANLLARVDVEVASFLFLIDLPDLKGGERLAARKLKYHALIEFEGD